MSHIPLIHLKRQLRPLKREIISAIEKIFDATEFTYGKDTQLFEKLFAKTSQTKYSLGVSSGTDSLIIALKAAQIQSGDEVITTPVTFSATTDAILQVGAKPVFVDVDPKTGNIDPKKISSALTTKTKALLVVHLYGVPAEMKKITSLCKKHQLLLIEDASHAHGSLYEKKAVGSFGLAGCFSLYPSKTLGAFGNAGVITSNDRKFISLAKMYAHHGIKDQADKYTHHLSGTNNLIDNVQAAVLVIKMKSLQDWIERKKTIAEQYNQVFNKHNHPGMVWDKSTSPSLYVYSVQISQRKKFQEIFAERGIQTGVYYPTPLHLQPSMKGLDYKKGDFPSAEKFAQQTISLPLYPELRKSEINTIIEAIDFFFKK